MSGIPSQIDETMWSVVELDDPRALDEFAARYPAYRDELTKRLKLVRGMKSAIPHRPVPRFHVPTRGARPALRRPILVGSLALGLALVSFAMVSNYMRREQSPPAPPSTVNQLPKSPSLEPHQRKEVAPQTLPTGDGQANVTKDPDPPTNLDRHVTVDVKSAGLRGVIGQIASQAALSVEFAPGFEDQLVRATYIGVPAKDALADLGQNFGFTALAQGERKVLIVPALDPGRPVTTPPSGSFSEPSPVKSPVIDPGFSPKEGNN